jgi:hypothetical protein
MNRREVMSRLEGELVISDEKGGRNREERVKKNVRRRDIR